MPQRSPAELLLTYDDVSRLNETSKIAQPEGEGTVASIPPLLLATTLNDTVAHFLHSLYGGKFTTKFGYRRPKDLALALAAGGYVSISHHTTTLYIEPTAKLVGATPDQGSG